MHKLTHCAAGIGLALVSPVALAAPLTHQFTGQVSSISGNNLGAPWNGATITVGTPVTIQYTFDTTTTDTIASPTSASYTGAISSITLTLGTASATWSTSTTIDVQDSTLDSTEFSDYSVPGTGPSDHLLVSLSDSSATVFTSDALPLSFSLSDFDSMLAYLGDPFGIEEPFTYMEFALTDFTTIVPEPTALAGVLAGGLALRRRRSFSA